MSRFVPSLSALPGPARKLVELPGGQLLTVQDWPAPPGARRLIAIPGLRGTDQGLSRIISGLGGAGWAVRVVNLPGMGLSPTLPGRTYDLAQLAQIIAQVSRRWQAKVLLGHSFGATVACASAANLGPDLEGLVLLSPIPRAPATCPGVLNRLATLLTRLYCWGLRAGPVPLARAWCDRPGRGWASNLFLARRGISGWLEIERKSREQQFLATDPGAVADAQQAATWHDCTEFASELAGYPVALVAGGADDLASRPDLHRLARMLGNARLEFIAGAGHLAHHEDTAALAGRTLAALASLASPEATPLGGEMGRGAAQQATTAHSNGDSRWL